MHALAVSAVSVVPAVPKWPLLFNQGVLYMRLPLMGLLCLFLGGGWSKLFSYDSRVLCMYNFTEKYLGSFITGL